MGGSNLLCCFAGISNTIGRSVGGILANLSWVNYLHLNNVTLFIAGCATMLVGPACKTFSTLVVYAVVLGFCIGEFVPGSFCFQFHIIKLSVAGRWMYMY